MVSAELREQPGYWANCSSLAEDESSYAMDALWFCTGGTHQWRACVTAFAGEQADSWWNGQQAVGSAGLYLVPQVVLLVYHYRNWGLQAAIAFSSNR
jgi:hypothetical protein